MDPLANSEELESEDNREELESGEWRTGIENYNIARVQEDNAAHSTSGEL